MVFLPPRSSKSVICSKLFPAWYIGNFAHHEIMSVSHSDQLASDFGRTVRDIVNTEVPTDISQAYPYVVTLRQQVNGKQTRMVPIMQQVYVAKWQVVAHT
jgi:hypothetical protein